MTKCITSTVQVHRHTHTFNFKQYMENAGYLRQAQMPYQIDTEREFNFYSQSIKAPPNCYFIFEWK